MIPQAIQDIRKRGGLPVDPSRRGPVPLDRFYDELNLGHVTLTGLTCGRVTEHLLSQGVQVEPVGEPDSPLAGCLFWVGEDGLAFINGSDILTRRRFTAAHELGHAVLHRSKMGRVITDAKISDSEEAGEQLEREANQFAAELLMPVEVCRARADELRRLYNACPRIVLAYRLASELLVSREAMRFRLKTLGIGDDD